MSAAKEAEALWEAILEETAYPQKSEEEFNQMLDQWRLQMTRIWHEQHTRTGGD